jgi:hypothetical protein
MRNSIERSYFETFFIFFLRKIHFAISTAQKQYLMTAGFSINSYNESGWVLKSH